MSLKINKYTTEELRAMYPFIAAADGSIVAAALIFGAFSGFDWRLFSGLLCGNALMLINFVLIGYTADKAVKCRDFRRARSISSISYGLRYIGQFAVLAALLSLGVINIVTALIPLFYPKIYYTFFYALTRGKDDV